MAFRRWPAPRAGPGSGPATAEDRTFLQHSVKDCSRAGAVYSSSCPCALFLTATSHADAVLPMTIVLPDIRSSNVAVMRPLGWGVAVERNDHGVLAFTFLPGGVEVGAKIVTLRVWVLGVTGGVVGALLAVLQPLDAVTTETVAAPHSDPTPTHPDPMEVTTSRVTVGWFGACQSECRWPLNCRRMGRGYFGASARDCGASL